MCVQPGAARRQSVGYNTYRDAAFVTHKLAVHCLLPSHTALHFRCRNHVGTPPPPQPPPPYSALLLTVLHIAELGCWYHHHVCHTQAMPGGLCVSRLDGSPVRSYGHGHCCWRCWWHWCAEALQLGSVVGTLHIPNCCCCCAPVLRRVPAAPAPPGSILCCVLCRSRAPAHCHRR